MSSQGRSGGGRGGGRGGGGGGRGGGGGGRGGSQGGSSQGPSVGSSARSGFGRSSASGRGDYGRGSGRSGFNRGVGGGGGGGGNTELKKVLTNMLPATLSASFKFYRYSVDSVDKSDKQIESRGRRAELFGIGFWDGLLKNLTDPEKKDLRRHVYFGGSFFFTSKPIPGLEKEKLPLELVRGNATDGDVMTVVAVDGFTAPKGLQPNVPVVSMGELAIDSIRCSMCSKTFRNKEDSLQHCKDTGHTPSYVDGPGTSESQPATEELFLMYVNMALDKAMTERLLKWGKQYYDRNAPMEAKDRQGRDLGVSIFEAISLTFGLFRIPKLSLCLTCDLRAKVIRNVSVLDTIYENRRNPNVPYTESEQKELKRKWIGEVVIYKNDRKCYTIKDLDFKNSPNSLPIPGKNISHQQYFASKGIKLEYPNEKPMIVVEGRQQKSIFLPPELVMGNELDPKVREMLPIVASFKPEVRNRAIEKVKDFLIPASQTSTGGALLPALGIVLKRDRIQVDAEILQMPALVAAGIKVQKTDNFAPEVSRAKFNVEPQQTNLLKVVVFYNRTLQEKGAKEVYNKIRNLVNGFKTHFNFGPNPHLLIATGENEQHWGPVEQHVTTMTPPNYFILDFCKPRSALDPAYPVVKHVLSAGGYLSQPKEERKSMMILEGVARQILQKAGARLWWVDIPRELPLPVMFVGVDVFHAPVVLDPKTKKKGRKSSVAAICVEVISHNSGPPTTRLQSYTRTFSRAGGTEYFLGDELKQTMAEAVSKLKVQPKSVVVWRDGMPETAYSHAAEEMAGIQEGLKSKVGTTERLVPMSYIVCQKSIDTKFLTVDGKAGAPSGTMVKDINGPDLNHSTFYINGRAPPFSTPKPVRFIVMRRDGEFKQVPLARLTWSQCHAYPNWLGPIKVPSVTMKAHKLAELAGAMVDAGDSINHSRYLNRDFFL